jgi:type VI secretion system secreted protein Hcp
MKKLLSIIVFTAALALSNPVAAFDAFLVIDGIQGESTDAAHAKSIEVLSFSWGMTQTGISSPGGGGGAGKVNLQDVHFVKFVDKATTQLMLHCATGKHIPKATLYVRDTRNKASLDYLIIVLEDVLISSYQVSGNTGGDDRPTESLSLNFAKVKAQYFSQGAKGNIEGAPPFNFNVRENTTE